MKRLPIHPQPLPNEALSSWIYRLADSYGLPSSTFMERAFGDAHLSDQQLDLAPPADLLMALAERTRVSTSRLHSMTLAGYTPLVLD